MLSVHSLCALVKVCLLAAVECQWRERGPSYSPVLRRASSSGTEDRVSHRLGAVGLPRRHCPGARGHEGKRAQLPQCLGCRSPEAHVWNWSAEKQGTEELGIPHLPLTLSQRVLPFLFSRLTVQTL